MKGVKYSEELKDDAEKKISERGFGVIHPSCPYDYGLVVSRFYNLVQEYHSITYGNDNSIFLGLDEVSKSFKSHISSFTKFVDVDLLTILEIDNIGYEKAKKIRQSYEATSLSASDAIEKSIFEAENLLIEAMKKSFNKNYASQDHQQLTGLLETTRFLFEFLRTRHPRRHLYINDQLDETRRKARPIRVSPVFCELCWRLAKKPTKESRDIKPRFCRVHNQDRQEVAKELCNLRSVQPSKYRNDLRKKSYFCEALSEIQTKFVPLATYSDRPIFFDDIDIFEKRKIYFSALKQMMRNRYIAYYVAKNAPRKSVKSK